MDHTSFLEVGASSIQCHYLNICIPNVNERPPEGTGKVNSTAAKSRDWQHSAYVTRDVSANDVNVH